MRFGYWSLQDLSTSQMVAAKVGTKQLAMIPQGMDAQEAMQNEEFAKRLQRKWEYQ